MLWQSSSDIKTQLQIGVGVGGPVTRIGSISQAARWHDSNSNAEPCELDDSIVLAPCQLCYNACIISTIFACNTRLKRK